MDDKEFKELTDDMPVPVPRERVKRLETMGAVGSLFLQGKGVCEIAELTGLSTATIYSIINTDDMQGLVRGALDVYRAALPELATELVRMATTNGHDNQFKAIQEIHKATGLTGQSKLSVTLNQTNISKPDVRTDYQEYLRWKISKSAVPMVEAPIEDDVIDIEVIDESGSG